MTNIYLYRVTEIGTKPQSRKVPAESAFDAEQQFRQLTGSKKRVELTVIKRLHVGVA